MHLISIIITKIVGCARVQIVFNNSNNNPFDANKINKNLLGPRTQMPRRANATKCLALATAIFWLVGGVFILPIYTIVFRETSKAIANTRPVSCQVSAHEILDVRVTRDSCLPALLVSCESSLLINVTALASMQLRKSWMTIHEASLFYDQHPLGGHFVFYYDLPSVDSLEEDFHLFAQPLALDTNYMGIFALLVMLAVLLWFPALAGTISLLLLSTRAACKSINAHAGQPDDHADQIFDCEARINNKV